MNKNKTTVTKITAAIILAVSITGGAYFLEDRYASSSEVAEVGQRLSVHTIQDQIKWLQQSIWVMEDRCGNDPSRMTTDQRIRYREMQVQKKQLERQLNSMMKGKQ